MVKSNLNKKEASVRLFAGETNLVITGMIGFILSAFIAIYILFQGPIVLPEGNMQNAFSFNAAIGLFILSIAAIMPLTKFDERKKKRLRLFFMIATFYSYTIETIQNFRGLNPRFSLVGGWADTAAGMFFGVTSIVLVVLSLVLMVHFLRLKAPYERPLLILTIRYAFFSIAAANIAGIWMILLQGRFTGGAGNFIVFHGLGFHALQSLILPAWFFEKVQGKGRYKKGLLHLGSVAWMLAIIIIGIQTVLGRSVFELTILPIAAGCFLLVWFITAAISFVLFIKQRRRTNLTDTTGFF